MSNRRPRLKTLALSLSIATAALGIMAATVLAEWSVEGDTLEDMEVGRMEAGIDASASGELLLLVPGLKLIIHCKKAIGNGGRILRGTEIHGTLSISECTTLQNEKTSTGCKPTEPIAAKGKGLLILHEGKTFILFEHEGSSFTTIKFNEFTCGLPAANNVSGSFVAECSEPSLCETESVTHAITPASSALFSGDKVLFGLSQATLDGTVSLKLNGEVVEEDASKKWSGKG